jgi:LysR family transcriptional regulator, glycine cleavage system transcriptional activator
LNQFEQTINLHLNHKFCSCLVMPRRLPPLNALRAFEAGARRLNFTRAAGDLSVTQTAVSHQIKLLEEWVGQPLFQRHARNVELTNAGRVLYPAVAQAFDLVAEAAQRARESTQRSTLTVTVTPTFGTRWLAPRLGRFWRDNPDIDLRIHHSLHLIDINRESVDLGVRWGRGEWPGLVVEPLLHAHPTPVCSPDLISGERPLREPRDLAQHTLVHEQDFQEWVEWLTAAGFPEVDGRRGPIIDNSTALLRAVLDGNGVMMGIPALLDDELKSGRLVAPFETAVHEDFGYYLVYRPAAAELPKVRTFREYLMSEVESDVAEREAGS